LVRYAEVICDPQFISTVGTTHNIYIAAGGVFIEHNDQYDD